VLAGIGAERPKVEFRRRIEAAIDSLADNPRPSGSKILQGRRRYTRIRVGKYRVVYLVEDERITIVVVRIGPRKDIYRGL